MATPKRKRNSNHRANATNKKRKHAESSDTESSEQLWQAECILKERRVGRKLQYLIKWKGVDPATLQEYAPTWEPEENPNAELLVSWTRAKALRASLGTQSKKATPKKGPTPRPRKSRVVESIPESSTAHPSTTPSRASTPERKSPTAAITVASSIATTPIAGTAAAGRAQVLIRPPGDFDPEEYDRDSQLAASLSPTSAPPSHTQDTGTDLDSSQLFAAGASSGAPQYNSSGVVQDTQSSAGERSYVAPTQQTTGTTQPSSTAEDVEDATEDSGLLEIVQQATASQAPSPARSIPETIYDTAESQSQHRRATSQERTEVPDTLEEVEDESQSILESGQHDNSAVLPEDEDTVQEPGQQQEESASHEQAASHETTSTELDAEQDSAHTRVEQELSGDSQAAETPLVSLEGALEPVAAVNGQASPDLDLEASGEPPTTKSHSSLASDDSGRPREEQDTQSGAVEATEPGVVEQHVVSQDKDQASLTEHSEQDETAQFPFHSQHTHHLIQDFAQRAAGSPAREETPVPAATDNTVAGSEAPEQTHQDEAVPGKPSAISPVEGASQQANSLPQSAKSSGGSTQYEGEDLLSQFLEAEYVRSQSPAAAQAEAEQETVVQSTCAIDSVEDAVRRRDFAFESQLPQSTDYSTTSREQNAQIVSPLNDLSTQEETTEDVLPSIEEEFGEQSSPASRHDSSQETPERRTHSTDNSSSPFPQPPSHSLGTFESNLPPRPVTPVLVSSLSNMASQDTSNIGQKMKAKLAEHQAKHVFTPTRRPRRSTFSPATLATAADSAPAPSSAPVTSPSLITPSRRLLRTGASQAADGTRSPSTVPDRSPAPSAPTSLRTVAHANQPAEETPEEEMLEEAREEQILQDTREETPKASTRATQAEAVEAPTPAVPAVFTTEPTVPEPLSPEDEDLSDVENVETESLLDDELQLAVEEYIVPLFIEGRQSDMYRGLLKQDNELLGRFLQDSTSTQPLELDKIEKILARLRDIETHLDLVFAEAGASSDDAMDSATQIEFAAHFGIENSTKFRFLNALVHSLRNQKKHVVLLVSQDNEALFGIIETFCKASFLNYNMPTKGRQADPTNMEGDLSITVFPSDTSPIIRPADVIICLDGVQDARQIRGKNWAANPDLEVVPILHLVIPRTIGHIERYLSPSLDQRERMHTILASLGHMGSEIGKPIDADTPRAPQAASLVAGWLSAAQAQRGLWPLTSIGSVKDVIEYKTQGSPVASASPAPERSTKRAHDDEELDPAKRMRFTPQPHPDSSMADNEITHISDSMPGTATDDALALRAQLARVEEAYQREKAARKAEDTRFTEKEAMWVRQQTAHEDLNKEFRLLLGQHQATEKMLATASENNETLRKRLSTRTEELRTVTSQLSEQRETHLLSDDAKTVEITRLRKDIAVATGEKESAIKSKQSSENTLDYTKEQYRIASESAQNSQSVIEEMEAKLAKANHAASGQPVALKKLHLDKQHKELAMQVRNLRSENAKLKRTLAAKEEELARAKLSGERMGVRTRGTSATPQPGKTRSRAASPRLSGLRNG